MEVMEEGRTRVVPSRHESRSPCQQDQTKLTSNSEIVVLLDSWWSGGSFFIKSNVLLLVVEC